MQTKPEVVNIWTIENCKEILMLLKIQKVVKTEMAKDLLKKKNWKQTGKEAGKDLLWNF